MSRSCDILIVGAGFVGLSFARALADTSFDVMVIDKGSSPATPEKDLSANVIAVSPTSESFITDLGAWTGIDSVHKTPFYSMRVWDGTGTGSVEFEAADAGLPVLGHIVDQRALRSALLGGVDVTWESAPSDFQKSGNGYLVQLESGDEISCDLLVAADGSMSSVREAVGLKTVGFPYDQHAVVTVAETAISHGHCARQWFTPTGPVAFLPLSDENKVAVVWSSSESEDVVKLDDEAYCESLTRLSESQLGQVVGVGRRFEFPLIQQQAVSYVAPNAALLGDAAHTIHPLAGQGANLGFADAKALATEIAAARLDGGSPGDMALLKRYQQSRRTENHLAALAMEGFHRLFTTGQPVISFLRNKGLSFVDNNDLLKQLAINLATGKL